jgi:multicomponent Na+:H+ antiporter subunit D
MPGDNNPLVLGPIMIPLLATAICLLLGKRSRAQRVIALAAGVLACACALAVLVQNLDPGGFGVQVYRLGGWATPFGIVLVADRLAALFGVMGSAVMAAGLLYCLECRDTALRYPVFLPAYLCMSAGLSGSFYTGDIFTFFVFIELMVIASVVTVAIADNPLGLEAAIKYLFMSALGTLLLLLGIAALYATYGTLTQALFARALESGERPLLVLPASVMIATAFLIKSAVVPFHFWQPDFHTTAPTPVSGVLSSVIVKVGIYGVIRITTLYLRQEAALIQTILLVLGVVGIFFGGVAALRTYNAKRMLAYSTLAQVGFILVAIGWGTPLALLAAVIYIVNHAAIKAGLLMLTGQLASRAPHHSANLSDLAGIGRGRPVLSLLYLLGGLALAGVPPLNGFISKVALVQAGVGAESWLLLGLVVGGGLLTLLYTTRTWQLIFQQPPPDQAPPPARVADSPLAPALLILACVLLGLYTGPLLGAAEATVAQLGRPEIYTCAVLADAACAGVLAASTQP